MSAAGIRRVLVTGASGFIGRWSVPALLQRDYEVHALVGGSGRRPPTLAGAQVHRADLFDTAATAALLATLHPTHLLHFAWIATPGIYWHSPDNARWLEASRRLLGAFAAAGGQRAVVAGSCAEYDWSRVAQCDESTSPLAHGSSAYATAKLDLWQFLQDFAPAHGLSAAWGRIFFQYGPDEHPQRLVPAVISALLSGREAPCTHGRQVRSFLHVADVGAAFAALLDSAVSGVVNIGSPEAISVAELVGRLAALTAHPELLRLGARPAGEEPAVLLPKVERLYGAVGWRPRLTLEAGLADTVDWWRRALGAAP